jgi:hypothetical protein
MTTCGEGTPDELEIHDRVTDFGVRISGPPPLTRICTPPFLLAGGPPRSAWPILSPMSWRGQRALFDHLVCPQQHRLWDLRPNAFAVFRLITSSNLAGATARCAAIDRAGLRRRSSPGPGQIASTKILWPFALTRKSGPREPSGQEAQAVRTRSPNPAHGSSNRQPIDRM